MSFLILAFRKMSLKRQMNQGNFKLMNISMKQQAVQNQLASLEEIKTTMHDAWTSIRSSASSISNSVFTAQVDAANSDADKYQQAYKEAYASGDQTKIAAAEKQMNEAAERANELNKKAWEQQTVKSVASVELDQAANSLFDSANKAQMTALNRQDKEYDLQKESLNTQMTAWESEYSNLDKSVQNAAKAAAPQYVA